MVAFHAVPDLSPSNLTGIAQDSVTILLSWNQPAGRHNGIIQGYRLNITELNTGQIFRNVSATASLVISNLHPDYTYEWRVAAVTVGEGPYSDSHRVTTFEDGKDMHTYRRIIDCSLLEWDLFFY